MLGPAGPGCKESRRGEADDQRCWPQGTTAECSDAINKLTNLYCSAAQYYSEHSYVPLETTSSTPPAEDKTSSSSSGKGEGSAANDEGESLADSSSAPPKT